MKKSVQTAIVREVEEVTTGNSNGNFCVVKPALLQSYTCPFASQNLPFCQDSRQFSTKVLTHKLTGTKDITHTSKQTTYIPNQATDREVQHSSPFERFSKWFGPHYNIPAAWRFLPNSWSPCFNTSRSWERYVLHIMSFIHFPSDFVHLPAVLLVILFCIASLRLQQTDHQTARQSNDTDSKPIDRLVFKQVYSGTQYNIRRNILNLT